MAAWACAGELCSLHSAAARRAHPQKRPEWQSCWHTLWQASWQGRGMVEGQWGGGEGTWCGDGSRAAADRFGVGLGEGWWNCVDDLTWYEHKPLVWG